MPHVKKFLDHFNLTADDFVEVVPEHFMHRQAKEDFLAMQLAAQEDGIDLRIISSLRDFDHQLNIWNGKADGSRVIRDDNEMIVNIQDLSEAELMQAIMRFSAVPGLSRHHFGTDVDVYDANAIEEGMRVSLVASEYDKDGPFAKLSRWLRMNCSQYGFYIPYSHDKGKLAQEPWHVSYREIVQSHTSKMTYDFMLPFFESFTSNEFHLVDHVKANLEQILKDYVQPY